MISKSLSRKNYRYLYLKTIFASNASERFLLNIYGDIAISECVLYIVSTINDKYEFKVHRKDSITNIYI